MIAIVVPYVADSPAGAALQLAYSLRSCGLDVRVYSPTKARDRLDPLWDARIRSRQAFGRDIPRIAQAIYFGRAGGMPFDRKRSYLTVPAGEEVGDVSEFRLVIRRVGEDRVVRLVADVGGSVPSVCMEWPSDLRCETSGPGSAFASQWLALLKSFQ